MSNYIRTKDGRILDCSNKDIVSFETLKIADTIKKLCDGYVYKEKGIVKNVYLKKDGHTLEDFMALLLDNPIGEIILFIETDKGLIYVTKMNENGELKLI